MADQVQMDPAEARRQVVAQLRDLADRIEANEPSWPARETGSSDGTGRHEGH